MTASPNESMEALAIIETAISVLNSECRNLKDAIEESFSFVDGPCLFSKPEVIDWHIFVGESIKKLDKTTESMLTFKAKNI